VVVASVVKCYDALMAANGVVPQRAPIARSAPPSKHGTPDVLDVRID